MDVFRMIIFRANIPIYLYFQKNMYKISSTQGSTIQSEKIAIAQIKTDHYDCRIWKCWKQVIFQKKDANIKIRVLKFTS